MKRSFRTESELTEVILRSRQFHDILGHTGWSRWEEREVEGLFGVPDFVCAFGSLSSSGDRMIHTFAFEMKLRNWRRALIQAFRYAAFAHFSYVVMDHEHVDRATRQLSLFRRCNVGLISVKPDGETVVHAHPRYQEPYSDSLGTLLVERVSRALFPIHVEANCVPGEA